ncbi:hypothetical protein DF186_21625, partial [Enterococcus hirae]
QPLPDQPGAQRELRAQLLDPRLFDHPTQAGAGRARERMVAGTHGPGLQALRGGLPPLQRHHRPQAGRGRAGSRATHHRQDQR